MATRKLVIVSLLVALALFTSSIGFAQIDSSCVTKLCSSLSPADCNPNSAPGCEASVLGCAGTPTADCASRSAADCEGVAACILSTNACTNVDNDKDGYKGESAQGAACPYQIDCNDNNANINPATNEVCDGVDNNCNGQIDEGLPTQTYYRDRDGDGFGDSASSVVQCGPINGYVEKSGDCNDNNANINPNAAEVCDNADNNCDSFVDNAQGVNKDGTLEVDAPKGAPPSGSACGEGACVGTTTYFCTNGQVNDPALECSSKGKDVGVCAICDKDGKAAFDVQPTDCAPVACQNTDSCKLTNGVASYVNYTDSAPNVCQSIGKCSTDAPTFNLTAACSFISNIVTTDNDHDGWTALCGDCNDSNSATHVNATEICDKQDNNCNGPIDETFDTDKDGFFNATCTGVYPASQIDTNDNNANTHPGGVEICDGVDNDGDGVIDNVNNITNVTITKCACSGKSVSEISSIKARAEINNGIDDNCDGKLATDEADFDDDSYANYQGDCNDNDADVNPGALEVCIGSKDDNCNGQIDEGCDTSGKNDSLIKTTLGAQNQSSSDFDVPIIRQQTGTSVKSYANATGGFGSTASLRGAGIGTVSVEENKSSSKGIVAIILAIIGAAGGGFYFMRMRAKASLDLEAEGFGVAEPQQAGKQDVKDFVSSSASQGYSATDIKNTLTEKGWDKEDVDKAVDETADDLESLSKISEKRGLSKGNEGALKGYIVDTKARGFSDEQIKAALVSEGWDTDTVETYFAKPKVSKPKRKKA